MIPVQQAVVRTIISAYRAYMGTKVTFKVQLYSVNEASWLVPCTGVTQALLALNLCDPQPVRWHLLLMFFPFDTQDTGDTFTDCIYSCISSTTTTGYHTGHAPAQSQALRLLIRQTLPKRR